MPSHSVCEGFHRKGNAKHVNPEKSRFAREKKPRGEILPKRANQDFTNGTNRPC
jgi:hypothetical protein